MQTVALKVAVQTDVGDVDSKFSSAGSSVTKFGDDVDLASRKADSAVSRLDGVAESADNMASSSSQAAGGLGDLGGALSLLPGPLGALGSGMEAAAPAIMGVTGAADLANLAMDKGRAVTSKLTTAVKTNIVVTKAATIAQKGLNLAMRLSPIGLIITGLTLLVAGFILAYKKSETFRDIVKKAIGVVANVVGGLVAVWDKVKGAISGVIDWVGKFVDKVVGAIGWVKDLIGKTEYASNLGDTLGSVENSAGQVGDAIRNGQKGNRRQAEPTPEPPVQINVNGALDPNAVGRQIADMVNRYGRRTNRTVIA